VLWKEYLLCGLSGRVQQVALSLTLDRQSRAAIQELVYTSRTVLEGNAKPNVYTDHATKRKQSSFIALILIISNIELSPGPSSSLPTQFSFGLMNFRSASKATLIHDVIFDHSLDIVALTETSITSDAPNAVSLDVVPVGYRVIHAHRGSIVETELLLC